MVLKANLMCWGLLMLRCHKMDIRVLDRHHHDLHRSHCLDILRLSKLDILLLWSLHDQVLWLRWTSVYGTWVLLTHLWRVLNRNHLSWHREGWGCDHLDSLPFGVHEHSLDGLYLLFSLLKSETILVCVMWLHL